METRETIQPELKTSQEWFDTIPVEHNFRVLDPDGWDRNNYQYSWFEEKITKAEFCNRVLWSTCMWNIYMNEWWNN